MTGFEEQLASELVWILRTGVPAHGIRLTVREIVVGRIGRGPLGAREIRSYQLAGTKFILVFEPFERRGEPRVAAIYLQ